MEKSFVKKIKILGFEFDLYRYSDKKYRVFYKDYSVGLEGKTQKKAIENAIDTIEKNGGVAKLKKAMKIADKK